MTQEIYQPADERAHNKVDEHERGRLEQFSQLIRRLEVSRVADPEESAGRGNEGGTQGNREREIECNLEHWQDQQSEIMGMELPRGSPKHKGKTQIPADRSPRQCPRGLQENFSPTPHNPQS